MKKKLLIVAVIAAATLALCAPAFAWPVSLPWWQPTPHFTCVGKIMAGMGTLIALGSGIYATIASGPFASLFRSSKTIAADPSMMAQLQSTPIAQQAPLVAVTDRLPDVAGVGTTQTEAGKALAIAVPSTTVQPVATKSI